MTHITASWPASILSPNSRVHWRPRAKAKKAQRVEWATLAVAHQLKAPRDADNLLASCKAGLDGLADAMGVNDSRFRITFDMGEPVKGGACVKVWVA